MPKSSIFTVPAPTFKLILTVGALIIALTYKPLIFLLPGILFSAYYLKRGVAVSSAIGLSTVTLLAFWATIFPFLKFIPIPYTTFILFVSVISCLLFVLVKEKMRPTRTLKLTDILILLSFMLLAFLYIRMVMILPAPAGADMATHAYNTRVIMDKNGYPQTYEPVIPIKSFGFSPTGFGSLAGAIGLLSRSDAAQASLLTGLLSYPVLGISLYLLLTTYFSPMTSILTVFLLLITAGDIRGYLSWGGNPSVLSIAFLTTGIAILAKFIRMDTFDWKLIGLLSLFLVASFVTQPVPVIAFGYAIAPVVLYFLYRDSRRKEMFQNFLVTLLICVTLLIPFITSIKIPSQDTIALIREYSVVPTPYSIQGTWQTSLFHVPQFVMSRIGDLFFIIFLAGVVLSIGRTYEQSRWYAYATAAMFLLLLNSKHWVLPLSEALYADRILGTGTILFAFFTGLVLQTFADTVRNIRWSTPTTIVIVCALLWAPYSLTHLFIDPYKNIVRTAVEQTAVTRRDIQAFRWITQNVPIHAVFQNNEGDAGIWLPIYTGRKVIRNDASPQDYDELFEAESRLILTHVYVGDKVVYPGRMRFDLSQLSDETKYSLIYQAGNAKIYSVIR